MQEWLKQFPWTYAKKAVFVFGSVIAIVVDLVYSWFDKAVDPNLFTFLAALGGIAVAAMIGKRATTKVELEERQGKALDPQQPDVEFTP